MKERNKKLGLSVERAKELLVDRGHEYFGFVDNGKGKIKTVQEAKAAGLSNVQIDKTAGFKRNMKMAEYADVLLAIWDGESKGTKHMIDSMLLLRKPVVIVFHKVSDHFF